MVEGRAEEVQERAVTRVDGVDVLGSLSPSRAGDFMTCPLLYRFRTIDRLPEAPSSDALRGTVVHKVLEDLFDLPAPDRTRERAADLLQPAWEAVLAQEPEVAELFAGEDAPELAAWLLSCRERLEKYFDLEDPRRLEPAERELYVETLLDSKLLLRGFVDRLDVAPTGEVRVVDYKGLALDTPLPTPSGWTTMEEVRVGDLLLGSDGEPTRVTLKSEVHHRPCFRVTFADGTSVVCDNVHLWKVTTSGRHGPTHEVLDAETLHLRHRELVAQGTERSLWIESGVAGSHVITEVAPVESRPTQCIGVDAADSLYLCGEGRVPTHNTGRSPGEVFEAKALFQMKFYALVYWRTTGVVPAMLQLIYLGNSEVLRYVPEERDLVATERKVEAIWRAISRAAETGDWRPHRSALCSWCSHQAICPEFGGTPPPLPVIDRAQVADPGLSPEDTD